MYNQCINTISPGDGMAAMKILKWGNSLALRLPMALAKDAQLREGSTVNLRLEDGRVVVEPLAQVNLDALLEQITPETLHAEVATGPRRGREAW